MIDPAPPPPPAIEPKGWQAGLAPAYIGLFLWFGFLDQVGRRALPVGGLLWSALGAAAAGPAAYLLLYRGPAMLGHRARLPLLDLAAGAFGRKGAVVVPGLLLAVAQVLLFGLAVGLAVDLTFEGLAVGRLLDPALIRPTPVRGSALPRPLYLITALVWALATATVSLYFVRWIAALMQYFPIFPAALLGLAMVGTIAGIRGFAPSGVDPLDGSIVSVAASGWRASALTFQWVFAFSALAGVVGADWGSGSTTRRDVALGGWVGLALAPAVMASLSLIAVAGSEGRPDRGDPAPGRVAGRPLRPSVPPSGSTIAEVDPSGSAEPRPAAEPSRAFTLRGAIRGGFDPRIACGMLMVFGLASLAPGIFAGYSAATGLNRIAPGFGKLAWAFIVGTTGWLLVISGWQERAGMTFAIVGGLFAPVAAVLAAESLLRRGDRPDRAVGLGGLMAWSLGAVVGLAPTVAQAAGSHRLDHAGPAALGAFAVAFVAAAIARLLATRPARAGEPLGAATD